MPQPTLWTSIRHTLGRAFRETGQALDRAGIRLHQHAQTKRSIGDDPYIFDEILSRHRNKMPLLRRGEPKIDPDVAFIAPCSTLIGKIQIGTGSSVWYNAVIRGDKCSAGLGRSEAELEQWNSMDAEDRRFREGMRNKSSGGGGVTIGKDTNVQDGAVITADMDHTIIGDGVTIGHAAQIHSSTVGSHTLIGMGAILKPGSRVESYSFIAAGAVVDKNTTVPSGELWVGNPARKLRDLTDVQKQKLHYQADEYVKVAMGHRHVMELGGNALESVIENEMLEEGDENKMKVESVEVKI